MGHATLPRRTKRVGNGERDQLSMGWWVCAGLVGLGLLAGEYLGPLSALALALPIAIVVLIWAGAPPRTGLLPTASFWLILLFVVGCISAMATMADGSLLVDPRNLIRDVLIALSYLLFFVVGHRFSRRWEIARVLLGALVIVGAVVSVGQIALFFEAVTSGVQDLYVLRLIAGRGSMVQLCAIVAVYLLTKDMARSRLKTILWITAAICFFSIVLTLSRLILLQLLIFGIIFAATKLGGAAGTKLVPAPGRALLVGLGGVLTLTGAIYLLQFISREAFDFVWTGFVEKLLNSWTELTSTRLDSVTEINANYRAFESAKAMDMFADGTWCSQWFGYGWGTTVPLGLDTAATRNDFVRAEAAFLHNGFVNYLVKTGVIGAALYGAFMLHLAVRAIWARPAVGMDNRDLSRRQALLGTVLALVVGSVTAGGFGFPAGFLSVALLLGICVATPERESARPGLTTRETVQADVE